MEFCSKVSVIIPTYNRLSLLKNAIESVLTQTYTNFEIIVVDDGSSDGTRQYLLSLNDSRIKPILLDTNSGANIARNVGMRKAEGRYLAFLDDDDIFDNTKLEKLKSHIERCVKKPDIIYHNAKIVMINEKCEYLSRPGQCQDYFTNLLIENIVGGTPMVTINKSVIAKCGYFDESLFALEDYGYWLKAAKYGARFLYIDEPLTICKYRTKSNSVSKNTKNTIEAFDSISKLYEEEIKCLSPGLRRKRIGWFNATLGHKYLCNYRRVYAAKHFIMAFFLTLSIKYLISAMLSFFSPMLSFRVRSRISPPHFKVLKSENEDNSINPS